MAEDSPRLRLDQILIKEGLITEEQIKEALSRQKVHGGKFGSQLLYHGYIDETGLVKALAKQFNCDGVVLSRLDIPEIILKFIPRRLAIARKIIPFDYDLEKNLLKIACEDPNDSSLHSEINFVTRGKDVKFYIAAELALNTAIAKFYMGANISDDDKLLLEIPSDSPSSVDPAKPTEREPVGKSVSRDEVATVLLVTDEQGECGLLKNLLENDRYRVVVTDCADKAIEILDNQRFHTVLIKDTVAGDYLDLIDRVRKLSPSTIVRYYSTASSLVLDSGTMAFEEGLLCKDLELFTTLLAFRDGRKLNHSGTVGFWADGLCRRLGIPQKDRLAIVDAAYVHDMARYYYQVDGETNDRQLIELTAKLLESLDYSPVVIGMLKAMYKSVKGKFTRRLPIEVLGGNILTIVDTFCKTVSGDERLSLDRLDRAEKKLKPLAGDLILPEILDAFLAMLRDHILRFHTEQRTGQVMLLSSNLELIGSIEHRLKNEGFRVISANNAESFSELYRRSTPDIMVLISESGAFGASKTIRELECKEVDFKQVPTFVLTDQNTTSSLEPLFKMGIEDVIPLADNIDLLIIKMRRIRERLLEKERSAAEGDSGVSGSSGDLTQVSLIDLLRRLHEQSATVKVTVSTGRSSGDSVVICFGKGEPVFAMRGGCLGAEAIYQAALWSEGSWSIDHLSADDVPDNNIGQGYDAVLLECVRLVDQNSSQRQPAQK